MKQFLLLVSALLLSAGAIGQTREVQGTVTSAEDGLPIVQLAVQVKGMNLGTVTDARGRYRLSVPSQDAVLVFAYVGMETQEIVVGEQAVIDVVMQPANLELEQVVVTALGISRSKKALGYAVQEVSGQQLSQVRGNNFGASLGGRVAGGQIRTATGQLGGGRED